MKKWLRVSLLLWMFYEVMWMLFDSTADRPVILPSAIEYLTDFAVCATQTFFCFLLIRFEIHHRILFASRRMTLSLLLSILFLLNMAVAVPITWVEIGVYGLMDSEKWSLRDHPGGTGEPGPLHGSDCDTLRTVRLQTDAEVMEGETLIVRGVLQLLVENAVKHNRRSDAQPLHIRIRREDDFYVVENDYRPMADGHLPSAGIGQQNVRERYRVLGADRVETRTDGGKYIVRIPILYPTHAYEDTDH